MDEDGNLVLVLSGDVDLPARVGEALAALGWRCQPEAGLPAALRRLERDVPAAMLIDGATIGIAAAVGAVRQLSPPANATPLLVVGGDGCEPVGCGGHLGLPFDTAAFVRLLEQWAGPLDDPAFRAAPYGRRYRLVRLLGLDNADAILARLKSALREAVEEAGRDEHLASAHRLAGLVGMVGFAELSGLWSAVDRGEPGALDRAVAGSRAVLDELG